MADTFIAGTQSPFDRFVAQLVECRFLSGNVFLQLLELFGLIVNHSLDQIADRKHAQNLAVFEHR